MLLNSLSNGNFLDWSKSKAFADDTVYVDEKSKFVGDEHFPTMFSKYSCSRLFYAVIVWKRVKSINTNKLRL